MKMKDWTLADIGGFMVGAAVVCLFAVALLWALYIHNDMLADTLTVVLVSAFTLVVKHFFDAANSAAAARSVSQTKDTPT